MGGSRDAFIAETERCFGCQAIADETESFEKRGGNMRGLRVFLRPNPALDDYEDDED